jgi:hypothetical protein
MKEAIKIAFPKVVSGGCLESTTETVFHIFDSPDDPKRCFIKRQDEEPEHFKVKNPQSKVIHFLAIDKCIFSDTDVTRCDCAIFDETHFNFIEISESKKLLYASPKIGQ